MSETFKIIFRDGHNLFEKLSVEQFRTIRRRMVECILATDMATHAHHYSSFKSKLDSLNISNGNNLEKLISPDTVKDYMVKNNEVQQMILSECVHTSDLSSPAKSFDVCDKMLDLVYIEFFNQGDKEKELGLPVSMLCDRATTNINKSQIGFIKFVVNPQFMIMHHIMPEIQEYLENIQTNLKYYEKRVEQEEKEKEKLQEKEQ